MIALRVISILGPTDVVPQRCKPMEENFGPMLFGAGLVLLLLNMFGVIDVSWLLVFAILLWPVTIVVCVAAFVVCFAIIGVVCIACYEGYRNIRKKLA